MNSDIIFFSLLISSGVLIGGAFTIGYFAINDNDINYFYLEDSTILITTNISTIINKLYMNDLQVEIPVCLYGNAYGNNMLIDTLWIPNINNTNISTVSYESCDTYYKGKDFIGTIHNHPGGDCKISIQDLKTHITELYRGNEIQGIYCNNKIFIYAMSRIPTMEVIV